MLQTGTRNAQAEADPATLARERGVQCYDSVREPLEVFVNDEPHQWFAARCVHSCNSWVNNEIQG
jgi:hypothetical protein